MKKLIFNKRVIIDVRVICQNVIIVLLVFCSYGCSYSQMNGERIYKDDCELYIELVSDTFESRDDVEIIIKSSVFGVFFLKWPIYGMRVRNVEDKDLNQLKTLVSNDGDFSLRYYSLDTGLVTTAWENIARKIPSESELQEFWVDPGDYYVEIIYCCDRGCDVDEIKICRSAPFKIQRGSVFYIVYETD